MPIDGIEYEFRWTVFCQSKWWSY